MIIGLPTVDAKLFVVQVLANMSGYPDGQAGLMKPNIIHEVLELARIGTLDHQVSITMILYNQTSQYFEVGEQGRFGVG